MSSPSGQSAANDGHYHLIAAAVIQDYMRGMSVTNWSAMPCLLMLCHLSLSCCCAQVKHIFQWVKDRAGFEASFRVIFYPAEYNKRMLGVFPIGDPIPYVPEEEVRM